MSPIEQFENLLRRGAGELYADHPDRMSSGELVPTPNVVDERDVDLFFRGVEAGLITVLRGGRFNTCDRPVAAGRWALLSRSERGGWYNAEYLPQIAAYVEAVLDLGYPRERVLFELPSRSLQLDLAILDDHGRVVVLGEAKRATPALRDLHDGVLRRFSTAAPTKESKTRGDEQRQLAWRLWTVAPAYTWLIGSGHREALLTEVDPLRLTSLPRLPHAADLRLDHVPGTQLAPPRLL